MVDAARESPSTPSFLIVDEINRGNLAKIFGELHFLVEYRDQNLDLLYATDDDIGFTLQKNVFIIGTMNTTDRIDDDDFKISPSYSMRPAVHHDGGLERAWRTAILPLLEGHHYGNGVDVGARYGLTAIRAQVLRKTAAVSDGDETADPA